LVNVFVHWLYTQDLPDSHYDEAWNQITGTQRRDISEIIMVLAQAYSFGDRFLIPSFRITVNQLFVDAISKEWLHPTSVLDLATWTFEHIPADRPLLQLLTNQFCEDWQWDAIDCAEMKDKKAVAKALKALPTAFVVRTMRRCSELSKTAAKRWELKEPCYLEHDTDEEKDAGDKAHMVYCEDMTMGGSNKGVWGTKRDGQQND
jgi:hypothetical protein